MVIIAASMTLCFSVETGIALHLQGYKVFKS